MKYFKTTGITLEITQIEIERETNQCVWINGYRSAKRTDCDNYFPTFQEAKDFKIDYLRKSVKNYQNRIENLKQRIEISEKELEKTERQTESDIE